MIREISRLKSRKQLTQTEDNPMVSGVSADWFNLPIFTVRVSWCWWAEQPGHLGPDSFVQLTLSCVRGAWYNDRDSEQTRTILLR